MRSTKFPTLTRAVRWELSPDVWAFWDNAERVGDLSGVGAWSSIVDSLNRV